MKCCSSIKVNQRLFVVVLGLVVLQTPIVVWLWSKFPSYALIFKSIADFIIIISFLVSVYLIIKNWSKFKKYHTLLSLIGIYMLITTLASLFTWGQWQGLTAGLVIDLRYVLTLTSGFALGVLDKTWVKKNTKIVLFLGLIVSVFALLQVTILPRDFLANFGYSVETIQPYQLIDENEAYVRINSTLRGPNPLGAFSVIVLALALSRFYSEGKIKQANKSNFALILLAGLSLFSSHSRSAWLAGALVVVACLVFYFKSARQLVKWSILAGLSLMLLGLGFLIIKDDNHSLVDEFQHLILHENTETSHISSDEERQSSLTAAINLIKDRPILGHGVGSAGSASLLRQDGKERIIENQFLFVWYETGLVGLIVFLSLYGVVLNSLFKLRQNWVALGLLLSGVGLVVVGLFLPVFVDSAVAVIWWGLSGATIGKLSYNKRKLCRESRKSKS